MIYLLKMVIFHGYVSHNQRGTIPMATWWRSSHDLEVGPQKRWDKSGGSTGTNSPTFSRMNHYKGWAPGVIAFSWGPLITQISLWFFGIQLSSWWFQPTPLKNMRSSVGMIIPNIWINKTCSKPPTSSIHVFFVNQQT